MNLLSVEEVQEYHDDILRLVDLACKSLRDYGSIISAQTIYDSLIKQEMFVIGFFTDDKLQFILVFQLQKTNEKVMANIVAVAGKNMMLYNRLFGKIIDEWFREFGAQVKQVFANDRLAKIYQRMEYQKAYNVLFVDL